MTFSEWKNIKESGKHDPINVFYFILPTLNPIPSLFLIAIPKVK